MLVKPVSEQVLIMDILLSYGGMWVHYIGIDCNGLHSATVFLGQRIYNCISRLIWPEGSLPYPVPIMVRCHCIAEGI